VGFSAVTLPQTLNDFVSSILTYKQSTHAAPNCQNLCKTGTDQTVTQTDRHTATATATVPAIRELSSIEQQIGYAKKKREKGTKKKELGVLGKIVSTNKRESNAKSHLQRASSQIYCTKCAIWHLRVEPKLLPIAFLDLQQFMPAKQHVKSVMRENLFVY